MDLVKPEEKAREVIDQLLSEAEWTVQDWEALNLGASLGVAVREFPLKSGFADYMLLVDRLPVGVIEAKPFGTTLSGVADQSEKYLRLIPDSYQVVEPPPFAYESTGKVTFFRDSRDPNTRSRRVFAFHKPETLQEWLKQKDTLRGRLKEMPPLITEGLRKFKLPWDLTARFSYQYDKRNLNNIRRRLDANLAARLEITTNWRIQYTASIDLLKKEINYQSFNIYRNLHCWEMTFSWGPNPRGYIFFTFEIHIKESALRDIKLTKSSGSRRVY